MLDRIEKALKYRDSGEKPVFTHPPIEEQERVLERLKKKYPGEKNQGLIESVEDMIEEDKIIDLIVRQPQQATK